MLGEGKASGGRALLLLGVAHAAGGTAPDRGQPVAAGLRTKVNERTSRQRKSCRFAHRDLCDSRRVLHAFSKTYLDGNARHAALADRVGQP